jgi:hypothetical protein
MRNESLLVDIVLQTVNASENIHCSYLRSAYLMEPTSRLPMYLLAVCWEFSLSTRLQASQYVEIIARNIDYLCYAVETAGCGVATILGTNERLLWGVPMQCSVGTLHMLFSCRSARPLPSHIRVPSCGGGLLDMQ